MSSTASCVHTTYLSHRDAWTDPGPLRWPYLAYARDDVILAGEPAVCVTSRGVVWEYDGRQFLLTDVVAGTWRTPAGDRDDVPPGPWRHVPACACEACRLANV